ncbi:MAG: hypothetical protein ACKPKO_16280 [Candidatus Fonsibacter sp.]
MLDMDYRMVDVLNADQLEIGDLIGLGEDIVTIIEIAPLNNGFAITIENEFGEKDLVDIADEDRFDLYILD